MKMRLTNLMGFNKEVSIDDILIMINEDRSEEWTDYDKTDWRDGWEEWMSDYYELEEA